MLSFISRAFSLPGCYTHFRCVLYLCHYSYMLHLFASVLACSFVSFSLQTGPFETRKIPALEWLANKLEDAVHSIGLCPDWSCCGGGDATTTSLAGNASSPDHPSSLPNNHSSRKGRAAAVSAGGGRQGNHHGHYFHAGGHRGNQFRPPLFRRLVNNNGSLTTSVTSASGTTSQPSKSSLVGKISSEGSARTAVARDERVLDEEEEIIVRGVNLRSEWV